jgi:hypothetical protein
MTLYDFSIGVVDSLEAMSILSYQFSYNEKEEEIDYLSSDDMVLRLNSSQPEADFYLESSKIFGSVLDYNLTLPEREAGCRELKVARQDIFTKQQCLLYYQTLRLGTLADFAAFTLRGVEIEVVVTDSALFCVKNRRLPLSTNPNFSNLAECTLPTYGDAVLMTCLNSSTLSRRIFNVSISQGIRSCSVDFVPIPIPDALLYQDYNLLATAGYVVFEVPIRLENNKIYYKARCLNNVLDSSYSLLRRSTPNGYQTEFATIDAEIGGELLLLLEDGLGIYNVSDSSSTISPALWLEPA